MDCPRCAKPTATPPDMTCSVLSDCGCVVMTRRVGYILTETAQQSATPESLALDVFHAALERMELDAETTPDAARTWN